MFSGSSEQSACGNIEFRVCDAHSETSYLKNEASAMNVRSRDVSQSVSLTTTGLTCKCKSNEQLKKELEKLEKERIAIEEQTNAIKAKLSQMNVSHMHRV